MTHAPVLCAEVVRYLAPQSGGIYVDGTFGRGGYARAILAHDPARLYAFDRDADAIAAGQELAQRHSNLVLIHERFSAMAETLAAHDIQAVDGVTLDLGVSSPQLDDAGRGFSFRADGPLDMRMDRRVPHSAADLVNTASEQELADVIFHLGDEHLARRVARAIVSARTTAPIMRTLHLADIVRRVVPRSKDGLDPATRTFQALRIAVNDELGELRAGLEAAEHILRPGGRLVVVSFHALEDEIVKDFLRDRSGSGARSSRHLPANDDTPARFTLLTRRPIVPADAEIAANPRARSARLRAAVRTAAGDAL